MKQSCLLLMVCILTLSASAQQEKIINDANARPRNIEPFHGIQIGDGIDLYLSQGQEDALAVSATKEEYREKIVTRVEQGILKIYYGDERGWSISWRDRRLKVYVSAKKIDLIKASGGSDVTFQGTISGEKLSLELSGGSDFSGTVKITELLFEMSGGSDVHVRGSATNLRVKASGGSDFLGSELQAEYVIVEARGGSDAKLTANKELFADASGGSDIYYKGNPVIKHSSSNGGGSITRRD